MHINSQILNSVNTLHHELHAVFKSCYSCSDWAPGTVCARNTIGNIRNKADASAKQVQINVLLMKGKFTGQRQGRVKTNLN